jgi:single-strand DNA-binding protein
MARDLNQCNFIGRLASDPELRFMPSGEGVASFSIAVGSQWKDKDGNKKEDVEWVSASVFGKLSEVCGQYLKKGSKVFISGRQKTDKFTDKEGIERYSTKIIVSDMQMLDSKPADAPQKDEAPAPHQSRQQANNQRAAPDFSDMDSEIPF